MNNTTALFTEPERYLHDYWIRKQSALWSRHMAHLFRYTECVECVVLVARMKDEPR